MTAKYCVVYTCLLPSDVFLPFWHRSSPNATERPLPLSQATMMEPISSTPITVPCVPIGGAWGSSICSSSTRVPEGNSLRMRSTTSLLGNRMVSTSILKCRRTGEVLQQDLAFDFVFTAYEAQAQEKAAEGVLLIIHRFLRDRHALGVFAHLAECGNEMGVGFDRIGVRHLSKPGKCYPVFLNLNWKFANTERLLNQATFGIQQFSEVANRRFVQRN